MSSGHFVPDSENRGLCWWQSQNNLNTYLQRMSSYSVCLFRISQDLAKDLAMLAREIHDVAGEIDSVSPSSAPPASVRKQPDIYITTTTSMGTYEAICFSVSVEIDINIYWQVC